MTAPFAVGGASPAASTLEMLGGAPAGAASGTASPAAVDPSLIPFAGVLARIVGLQGKSATGTAREPSAMMRDALASLEAAINDTAPVDSTGTAAIRALIEQVARQGATATTAVAVTAPAVVPVTVPVVDAAAQALAAASLIAPPAAQVMSAGTSTRSPSTPSAAESSDDDAQAMRTDRDAEGTASTNAQVDASVTPAPGTVDPSVVVREAGALDPAFRAKLDRVIERMQAEFGHTVTLVETVRSQARQEALFEQGRTAPGPMVTWTRASRHADGMAADVMIDGRYDNPLAFQRLQRIAGEEGLHTLGARDPGHLELLVPQVGGFTAKASSVRQDPLSLRAPAGAALTPTQPLADTEAMARIARVARVAEVAVTAGVARVAQVARAPMPNATALHIGRAEMQATTGTAADAASRATRGPAAPLLTTNTAGTAAAPTPLMPGGATTSTASTSTTAAAAATAAAEAATPMRPSTTAATPPSRDHTARGAEAPAIAVKGSDASGNTAMRERATDSDTRGSRRSSAASAVSSDAPAMPFVSAVRSAGATAPVNAATGPTQAARVGQIDALQEQAATLPVSSMVLTVDDGNGGTDRIRVDVRGSSVASSIDVHSQQAATDLSAHANELARALESRGLESEGVRVRAVALPTGADALRQAMGGDTGTTRTLAAALGAEASTPSRRDRDEARDPRAGWTQQEQEQHTHRQRSRREREEQQP